MSARRDPFRLPRLLAPLALLLCAASCGREPSPATAIVVSVKTDLMVGTELMEIAYRVFAVDADPAVDLPAYEFAAAAQTIDRPFVVTPGRAEELLLSVEGFQRRGEEPIVVYRARARFEHGKSLALRVFLARSCAHKSCHFGGLTCYGETFGTNKAGQCAAVPGPELLDEIEQPGDESEWEPVPGVAIDAGSPWSPLWEAGPRPRYEAGLVTREAGP